jgi:hypothetical protein
MVKEKRESEGELHSFFYLPSLIKSGKHDEPGLRIWALRIFLCHPLVFAHGKTLASNNIIYPSSSH